MAREAKKDPGTDELRARLATRSTDDLVSILQNGDEEEWRPEVFEIVASILSARGMSPSQMADQASDSVEDFPDGMEDDTALSEKAAYAADQEDGATLVFVETKRPSVVIRAFIERNPGSVVKLDWEYETRPLDEWCTSKALADAIDLAVSLEGREILSFHDEPTELFAPCDQLPIVEELASKTRLRHQVFRYERPFHSRSGVWAGWIGCILGPILFSVFLYMVVRWLLEKVS